MLSLTLPVPRISQSFICGASKGFMKAFKAFIKPFEAPHRKVKIKILVSFFFLSGIGTVGINTNENGPMKYHKGIIKDHLFSTFTNVSEKLTFLISWYGLKNVSFSKNFANVLNEWFLRIHDTQFRQWNWKIVKSLQWTFCISPYCPTN